MSAATEFIASHFAAIVATIYLVIGATVAVFIASWSPFWLTRDDERVEEDDAFRRMFRLVFLLGSGSPIVFFIQVVLWPVLALYIWSTKPHRSDDDDNNI